MLSRALLELEKRYFLPGSFLFRSSLFNFTNSLAEAVGLNVPKLKLVEYSKDEWFIIKQVLTKLTTPFLGSEDAILASNARSVHQKMISELDRAFFVVMDFIDGKSLTCNYDLGNYLLRSTTIFNEYNHKPLAQALGNVIAFDIFINNSDRIPAVHKNDGNGQNIMIDQNPHAQADDRAILYAIDTCVVSIDLKHQLLLNNYVKSVEFFLDEIYGRPHAGGDTDTSSSIPNRNRVIKALQKCREFIYSETMFMITDEMCMQIAEGIKEQINIIASNVDRNMLSQLKQDVYGMVECDWNEVWAHSMAQINIDFLMIMQDIFVKYSSLEGSEERQVRHGVRDYDGGVHRKESKEGYGSELELELGLGSNQEVSHDGKALQKIIENSILMDSVENSNKSSINVLMVQMMHVRNTLELIDVLERHLLEHASGRCDIIVIPEDALAYTGPVPDTNLEMVSEFCVLEDFCDRHDVMVCVTVREIVSHAEWYTTALLFGPVQTNGSGERKHFLGKYRKRNTLGMSAAGDRVGVFETALGKIGILICYDIENEDLVNELLTHSPTLIINPTHLVPPSGQSAYPDLIESSWRIALDFTARNLEYISVANKVPVVRVDIGGSGNSMYVCPSQTILAPSRRREALHVVVDVPPLPQLVADSACYRIRTEKIDNSNLRLCFRILKSDSSAGVDKAKANDNNAIVVVSSFAFTGKPKGLLLVVLRRGVGLWDVAAGKCLYRKMDCMDCMGGNATEDTHFCCCVGSIDGRTFVAMDNNNLFYVFQLTEPHKFQYVMRVTNDDSDIDIVSTLESNSILMDQTHAQVTDSYNEQWDISCKDRNGEVLSNRGFCIRRSPTGDDATSATHQESISTEVFCSYHPPLAGEDTAITNVYYDSTLNMFYVTSRYCVFILEWYCNRALFPLTKILPKRNT